MERMILVLRRHTTEPSATKDKRMPRTTRGLTPDEIDAFGREGYLAVEEVLSDADLQPVIDELCREVTIRARERVEEGALPSTYEDQGFTRQLVSINREDATLLPSVSSSALSGPAIFRLITHPCLLDIAESLCGPELIASSVYRVRPKLPRDPRGEVPWHQDSGYTDPYCDNALIVTMWIPLLDATPENGCLFVLPRAHRGPVLTHEANEAGNYLRIPNSALPQPLEPVAVPIPKGGVLLLTNRTPHASFENRTDDVRWSLDLRYQSTDLPTNAPITRTPQAQETLARAEVPPACYPPSRDFLVRSRRQPDEVVTDPDTFHRIRREHRARFDAGLRAAKDGSRRQVAVNPFSRERWESRSR